MVTWDEDQVTRRKAVPEQTMSRKGTPDTARTTLPDRDTRRHTNGEWQPRYKVPFYRNYIKLGKIFQRPCSIPQMMLWGLTSMTKIPVILQREAVSDSS